MPAKRDYLMEFLKELKLDHAPWIRSRRYRASLEFWEFRIEIYKFNEEFTVDAYRDGKLELVNDRVLAAARARFAPPDKPPEPKEPLLLHRFLRDVANNLKTSNVQYASKQLAGLANKVQTLEGNR